MFRDKRNTDITVLKKNHIYNNIVQAPLAYNSFFILLILVLVSLIAATFTIDLHHYLGSLIFYIPVLSFIFLLVKMASGRNIREVIEFGYNGVRYRRIYYGIFSFKEKLLSLSTLELNKFDSKLVDSHNKHVKSFEEKEIQTSLEYSFSGYTIKNMRVYFGASLSSDIYSKMVDSLIHFGWIEKKNSVSKEEMEDR
jgi:prepilin signal peptidase PulO-like enzyme (type II secretory pathway)